MTELQRELLDTSKRYTDAKKKLEALERQYNGLYAQLYLQERITGMKTEEMRKNEMIRIMENEHGELLTQIQELKGDTRELYYKVQALLIILGGTIQREA